MWRLLISFRVFLILFTVMSLPKIGYNKISFVCGLKLKLKYFHPYLPTRDEVRARILSGWYIVAPIKVVHFSSFLLSDVQVHLP